MLGGFHIAKCVEHCTGNISKDMAYRKTSDRQVFGANVVDAVLKETNYACSLRGYLILANTIEKLKWKAFVNLCNL